MKALPIRLLPLLVLIVALSGRTALAQTDSKPAADTDDYVKTTTGLVFHGKIVDETPEQVVVLTKTGSVPIPRAIIQEVHKAGTDIRTPNEKIPAVTIPEGQEAAMAEKAKALVTEGKFEEAAGVCKGLMEPGPTKAMNDAQRDGVGRLTGMAFFELKDWPAAAAGLRYSARAIKEDLNRDRMLAMAEALEAAQPPTIGGETAGNFDQAMSLAMKWKAEKIFIEARDWALNIKDWNREEAVKRALQGADARLGKSEAYIPGYSIQKWPEVCRAMVTEMLATVETATAKCTTARSEMIRFYWQWTVSVEIGRAWAEKVNEYLAVIQASEDCLANVTMIDTDHPLKAAYKDEEYKQLTEQRKKLAETLEGLKFYDQDAKNPKNQPIFIKGRRIAPPRVGGN